MNKNAIDLFSIPQILFNRRFFILYFSGIVTILAIFYCLLATPYYYSYVSINPVNEDSRSPIAGLQGLVSTFGMDVSEKQNSFYIPDIVKSRILKKAVINNKWETEKYNDKVNLIRYWEIDKDKGFSISSLFGNTKDSNPEIEYIETAIDKLAGQISVIEEKSGLIVISVLMEESQLSADIANFIAQYIKDYISERMLLHSSKNRQFIEERLNNSKIELSISEEELTKFSIKYPIALDTPDLQIQRGRLLRNVEVNQQVYITLREQYEVARIDELKEIPVINILDIGEPPSSKKTPNSIMIILLSFISSIFLSSLIIITLNEMEIK